MHKMKRSFGWLSSALAFGLVVAGCSSKEEDGNSDGPSGSGSTTSSDDSGGKGNTSAAGATSSDSTSGGGSTSDTGSESGGRTSSASGGSTSVVVPNATCTGIPLSERAQLLGEDEAACTGASVETEPLPIDIFIMMDRSESMNNASGSGTRWDGIQEAVQTFVNDPNAAAIGIGIGFFNLSGGSDVDVDCDISAYAEAVVPIGLPEDVGADIVAAIDAMEPTGLTPTLPALEGAIDYAQQYHSEHAEKDTVVLLVTDGYPTLCMGESPLTELAEAAAAGFTDDPSVRTFVVGLAAGFNLNSIARSGGTGEAYLIDDDEDVNSAFLNHLLTLSSSEMACNLELPPLDTASEQIDPAQVFVTFESPLADIEEIPHVTDAEACESKPNGGWFFKDPNDPTQIGLCPCTCSRIGGGALTVRAGCTPIGNLG